MVRRSGPIIHGAVRATAAWRSITQSSNIALNLTMQARGLPLAYVVTVGNQAQTGMPEVAEGLLEDERVTALGLHIEGLGDVAAFEAMAARARDGQTVVVLKAGVGTGAHGGRVAHRRPGGKRCGRAGASGPAGHGAGRAR
jgi:hypothetical protein